MDAKEIEREQLQILFGEELEDGPYGWADESEE